MVCFYRNSYQSSPSSVYRYACLYQQKSMETVQGLKITRVVGRLGGREIGGIQSIFRAVKILCLILFNITVIHIIRHLFKPTGCAIPRMNLNVNYRLWVMMMCRCGFINCNKCIILVGDVDCRVGYACVGAGDTWEISVPAS